MVSAKPLPYVPDDFLHFRPDSHSPLAAIERARICWLCGPSQVATRSILSTMEPDRELTLVEIYTDGGCEPNPGAGGYGTVLVHPEKRMEVSGGFRLTTNNRMEIM